MGSYFGLHPLVLHWVGFEVWTYVWYTALEGDTRIPNYEPILRARGLGCREEAANFQVSPTFPSISHKQRISGAQGLPQLLAAEVSMKYMP